MYADLYALKPDSPNVSGRRLCQTKPSTLASWQADNRFLDVDTRYIKVKNPPALCHPAGLPSPLPSTECSTRAVKKENATNPTAKAQTICPNPLPHQRLNFSCVLIALRLCKQDIQRVTASNHCRSCGRCQPTSKAPKSGTRRTAMNGGPKKFQIVSLYLVPRKMCAPTRAAKHSTSARSRASDKPCRQPIC